MIYNKSKVQLSKLQLYTKAICNKDTNLKYPVNTSSKADNEYHNCLNNLTSFISEIQIESERNSLFYKQLIEQSDTGLIAFDDKGYIDIINNAARQLLNVKHIHNLKLLKHINNDIYSELISIKHGQSVTFKSIKIICTNIVFSERKFKLIALYDLKVELEKNEIESWQKLLSVLTHEMMNSIAPITSISNTLLKRFRNEYELSEKDVDKTNILESINALSIIEDRSKGLINFVENYRKLAKIPDPVFTDVDPKTFLTEIKEMYKDRFLRENIKLFESIDPKIQSIYTDRNLFAQIVINLVNNSIDSFTEVNYTAEKSISISVKNLDKIKVCFEISDNGCGIDELFYDSIFVPFFTTKENGNGIGLSLSRQIAKKLNARLYYKSNTNALSGSVFVIEF